MRTHGTTRKQPLVEFERAERAALLALDKPERFDVERFERLAVVELLTHWSGKRRVLVQDREVELVRPPVLVGSRMRALGCWRRDRRILTLAHAGGRVLVVRLDLILICHVGPLDLYMCPVEILTRAYSKLAIVITIAADGSAVS